MTTRMTDVVLPPTFETTASFTPGPWTVSGLIDARYLRGIGEVVLVRRNETNDDRYVAMVGLDAMGDDYAIKTSLQEREANARLIAAAPELLAALCGVVAVADRETDEFIRARAVIAAATGGAL